MSLNCMEIDAVLSELSLEGSFIQQIVQPGFDSLALHTYNGGSRTILICLAGGACRIHETRRAVPRSDKPLRFMEFLRSKIRGARIDEAAQIGRERVIRMRLSRCGERFLLYIRLWSGAANVILTDEGNRILDSFYRRPAKGEVSGGIFVPPEAKADDGADGGKWTVRSFRELPDAQSLSLNEKVDLWYAEHAGQLSRDALIEQAARFYTFRQMRMENAIQRLEQKRDGFLQAEKWRHYGDLILSYGHLLDGSSDYLECQDYEGGGTVRIKINAKKSAQDNAAEYYSTYKKSVSGLSELEHDIAKAKRVLLDLTAAYESLCREPNPIRLQQLLRKQTRPRQQTEKKRPGITYEIDGWTIFAGRTASENDELLRRHVKGQDMWLHARDFAGGYIFIKNRPGKTVPLEILLYAGNLAVYHSKARKAGRADLYYTQVKHLRRAKNGPKGLVLPTQEKNLFVELDRDRLKRLDESVTS